LHRYNSVQTYDRPHVSTAQSVHRTVPFTGPFYFSCGSFTLVKIIISSHIGSRILDLPSLQTCLWFPSDRDFWKPVLNRPLLSRVTNSRKITQLFLLIPLLPSSAEVFIADQLALPAIFTQSGHQGEGLHLSMIILQCCGTYGVHFGTHTLDLPRDEIFD
jgi:hypothetical protein